jgi:hypothetical protein
VDSEGASTEAERDGPGQRRNVDAAHTQEWRPDAAVVGWVAGCTCGWRGTCWTRVSLELADPAARRFAVTGPWADLEAPTRTG